MTRVHVHSRNNSPTGTPTGHAMNKPSIHTLLQNFETEQMQRQLPDFGPGDTVVVNVKVKEGNRERVQAYEGVVIAKKNARPQLRVHRAQDLARLRRRARVPDPQRDHRLGAGQASRRGARRQAVLPAWPGRQEGAHQGRSRRQRQGQGRSAPTPRTPDNFQSSRHRTAAAWRPFAFQGLQRFSPRQRICVRQSRRR